MAVDNSAISSSSFVSTVRYDMFCVIFILSLFNTLLLAVTSSYEKSTSSVTSSIVHVPGKILNTSSSIVARY